MNDDRLNISVSEEPSIVPQGGGTITKMEQNEKVTIKRTANHNEVSIMENIWIEIKRKVNLISLEKGIDVSPIIIGAMIPYIVDIISDKINRVDPDYFPFFVCCILLVICKWASKHIPWFSEDLTSNNKIHLEDLKNYIEQVDSTYDTAPKG